MLVQSRNFQTAHHNDNDAEGLRNLFCQCDPSEASPLPRPFALLNAHPKNAIMLPSNEMGHG